MGDTRFRIWFGDTPATAEALHRVETIEVIQEMDAIWEARLELVLCLDESGKWLHWPGDAAEPFSRVRIEIDIGTGQFKPLIDGPLVSIDASLDSQPGRSTATMVVRDDSAILNRDEENEPVFEFRRDSEIAEELFGRFPEIRATRIEATDDVPEATTRRGTVLQFLRTLARWNERHAYVLPGDTPGASIGCFLPDPTGVADLPPLRLIGDDRNLSNAHVAQDPSGGERTRARKLRANDQGITIFETSAADLGLMRDLPARPADLTPRRMLHPTDNVRRDPASAARGRARRAGYIYKLTSEVIPGCYPAVLTPYQKVRVDAGFTPYSGDYLITKVVHRITPSLYAQHIEAKTDSVTSVTGGKVAEALGGGLQVSASASVGIF